MSIPWALVTGTGYIHEPIPLKLGYKYIYIILIHRLAVCEAVLHICRVAMKKVTHKDCNYDWLYVLPLCHFLSGVCKPYDNIDYYPEKHQFYVRVEAYGYNDLRPNISPGYVSDRYCVCMQ